MRQQQLRSPFDRTSQALENPAIFCPASASALPIDTWVYRSDQGPQTGLLLLFDGRKRDAYAITLKAQSLVRRHGLIALAPVMDREAFPTWRYDRAGVIRNRRLQPRELWTAELVGNLVERAISVFDVSDRFVALVGHSAGGQLLSRAAAYSGTMGASRIVVANASVLVQPDRDVPVPYGFADTAAQNDIDGRLKAYLALPLTIYVGREDRGTDRLLINSMAKRLGPHRLARARNTYEAGASLAAACGWPFNWQLVEAVGVGHSSSAMLSAPEAVRAVGLEQ